MKEQFKEKQSFRQLLEILQQDSWQLELLISGFALFLLIGAKEPLEDLMLSANFLSLSITRDYLVMVPIMVAFVGWFLLLFNMFLHVLFRGLWISTIGLRYVSGEIDYGALRFSPRFVDYLRKRIGTFDRYIERLENICSILFAFTFLLVFIFSTSTLTFMVVS